MSGQQGLSFMNGAMRGYGFVDDVLDRRGQRDRQSGIDAVNTRRTGIADAQTKERHDVTMENHRTATDDAKMKKGYAALQAGLETPEGVFEVMHRNGLVPGEMMERADQELSVVESIMSSGDLSKFRSGDPLSALNGRLGPDINSDREGVQLPGRRQITDIFPGQAPGTAVFELAGEYEDGTPFKGQPMTKGRGSAADGDEEILQQHVDAIAKKLSGQRALLNEYKNNPEFKASLDKYASTMGWTKDAAKPIKVNINERLVDADTKKVLVDSDPFSKRGGKGGGAAPAILQETDAIFGKLPKKEGEDDNARWLRAHSIASEKTSTNPKEAGANFYKGILTKLLGDTYDDEERAAAEQYANKLTEQFTQTYYHEDVKKPGASDYRNALTAGAGNAKAPRKSPESDFQFANKHIEGGADRSTIIQRMKDMGYTDKEITEGLR